MQYVEMNLGAATLHEGPEPETPPGYARVKVQACGVCATDLHLLRGMVLPRGATYPVRPGHEVAGIVEELNAKTSAISEGDMVVLHPLAPCGGCRACLQGEDQRCEAVRALGMHDAGGFAEKVVWPVSRMLRANGLTPAAAALLADAAATAHNALRLARLPPGGALCVLGAGGLGTGALAVAKALDPTVRLAAVVRSEASAERLEKQGVTVHCGGLEGSARDLRHRLGRMDAVIDFSGQAEAPAEGVTLLRRGGRFVLGSVVDAQLALGTSSAFMAHELQVIGVYVSAMRDLAAVTELAHQGRLQAEEWVSHRRPLTEFNDAVAIAAGRPPGTVRVVVECDGAGG